MANTDRLQPDFNQEPDDDGQKSQSLSRDIDSLQSGIRVDFDQKLSELAVLLARFKALVVSPNAAANDDTVNTAQDTECGISDEPCGEQEMTQEQIADIEEFTPSEISLHAEAARFENGLYKLNSQLYRFRLELDQEMEFREEPLHLYFRSQSELSIVLRKISDHSSEKHPDN